MNEILVGLVFGAKNIYKLVNINGNTFIISNKTIVHKIMTMIIMITINCVT